MLQQVTFPGHSTFFWGEMGQPKVIHLHLPISTAPLGDNRFLGSCFLGTGKFFWQDEPHHTTSKPSTALPGSRFGWLRSPRNPVALRRHCGEADGYNPPSAELMCAACSTSAVK